MRSDARALHIDFALSHVVAHSRIKSPLAVRRLNGFENTLAALAVEWREWSPIMPEGELRMAESTRATLLDWITAEDSGQPALRHRLSLYRANTLIDAAVTPGWVRLLLAKELG